MYDRLATLKLPATYGQSESAYALRCANIKHKPDDKPKSGSYPAAVSWADGSQGGSGRVILAIT